ncbi:MAG TPA: hypothetical protein VJ875_19950 [Pyrinomonadaceae bacterium]|nr:hypothetical protein [Pyrinomonadaceae bacterium]
MFTSQNTSIVPFSRTVPITPVNVYQDHGYGDLTLDEYIRLKDRGEREE